mgnify:CR=1 FL=1
MRNLQRILKRCVQVLFIIEAEYEQYGSLKTLSYNQIIAVNQVGVKKVLRNHSFKAYLKEEEIVGEQQKKIRLLQFYRPVRTEEISFCYLC